jgi:hypothetical protein
VLCCHRTRLHFSNVGREGRGRICDNEFITSLCVTHLCCVRDTQGQGEVLRLAYLSDDVRSKWREGDGGRDVRYVDLETIERRGPVLNTVQILPELAELTTIANNGEEGGHEELEKVEHWFLVLRGCHVFEEQILPSWLESSGYLRENLLYIGDRAEGVCGDDVVKALRLNVDILTGDPDDRCGEGEVMLLLLLLNKVLEVSVGIHTNPFLNLRLIPAAKIGSRAKPKFQNSSMDT